MVITGATGLQQWAVDQPAACVGRCGCGRGRLGLDPLCCLYCICDDCAPVWPGFFGAGELCCDRRRAGMGDVDFRRTLRRTDMAGVGFDVHGHLFGQPEFKGHLKMENLTLNDQSQALFALGVVAVMFLLFLRCALLCD